LFLPFMCTLRLSKDESRSQDAFCTQSALRLHSLSARSAQREMIDLTEIERHEIHSQSDFALISCLRFLDQVAVRIFPGRIMD